MLYRWAADAVVVVHLSFVVFVVLGGFAAVRWPWLAWIHLPCATWGALIEFGGWICPLTPLENRLRRLGGEAGFEGGFVETYLLAALYPEGLTRTVQIALGVLVLAVNLVAYGLLAARRRRRSGSDRQLVEGRRQDRVAVRTDDDESAMGE